VTATRSKTLLLDLRLDKSITQDEYDKKARELKGRQNEIALRIEQHQEGEGEYRATLESLIYVASRAADIFHCVHPSTYWSTGPIIQVG
jgi:phage terminase large subunit-like protein